MLRKSTWCIPLAVSLLLALCACNCLALTEHICINDWITSATGKVPIVDMKSETVVAARVVADSRTSQNEDFAPIRIKTVFTNASCGAYGPHPRKKGSTIFRYYRRSCAYSDIITPEKRAILLDKILPGAVKLHAERLLVKPFKQIKVPNFTSGLCAEFAVPPEDIRNGVDDADMVLYVSALPTFESNSMWAFTCATLDGRSAVGVMNVGPDTIVDTPQSVRVAAHVMAHALGFTDDNMVAKKMVQERTDVRGKKRVRVVVGNETVKATRKHYNCESADGMELEDEVMTRRIPSHWERRNAKDELMAAITTAGYYTTLTMAAFCDMGHYRANWSMAETMPWGHQAGCNLLQKPCVAKGETEFPEMFCTARSNVDCTTDRMAIGRCVIVRNHQPVPMLFRYFSSPFESGDSDFLMDYCPIVTPRLGTGCTDGSARDMPGSVVGPNARCLRGQKLSFGGAPVAAVCADVLCTEKKVHVRLLGETTWRDCPTNDILFSRGNDLSGAVVCPAYEEVCVVRSAASYTDNNGKVEEGRYNNYNQFSVSATVNDEKFGQAHTQDSRLANEGAIRRQSNSIRNPNNTNGTAQPKNPTITTLPEQTVSNNSGAQQESPEEVLRKLRSYFNSLVKDGASRLTVFVPVLCAIAAVFFISIA